MITGQGMVASAFRAFADDDRIHVFASGVSRSIERDQAPFRREIELITAQRYVPGRFIYFSSCSVFDPSLKESPYIHHKLAVEDLIRQLYRDHLILRLPNLVGRTKNPNTLTNFLHDRIARDEFFELHTHACRYLLDVDDAVADLSPILLLPELGGATLDVCARIPIALSDLVHAMEQVLGKKARVIPLSKGSCYTIDNEHFMSKLPVARRAAYAHADTMALLKKYYG